MTPPIISTHNYKPKAYPSSNPYLTYSMSRWNLWESLSSCAHHTVPCQSLPDSKTCPHRTSGVSSPDCYPVLQESMPSLLPHLVFNPTVSHRHNWPLLLKTSILSNHHQPCLAPGPAFPNSLSPKVWHWHIKFMVIKFQLKIPEKETIWNQKNVTPSTPSI